LFAIFVDNDEESFRLTHGSHLEEYVAEPRHGRGPERGVTPDCAEGWGKAQGPPK
jgi:hypothetical protein